MRLEWCWGRGDPVLALPVLTWKAIHELIGFPKVQSPQMQWVAGPLALWSREDCGGSELPVS